MTVFPIKVENSRIHHTNKFLQLRFTHSPLITEISTLSFDLPCDALKCDRIRAKFTFSTSKENSLSMKLKFSFADIGLSKKPSDRPNNLLEARSREVRVQHFTSVVRISSTMGEVADYFELCYKWKKTKTPSGLIGGLSYSWISHKWDNHGSVL